MLPLLMHLLLQPTYSQYVTTFAGNGIADYADGSDASFYNPEGVEADTFGNVYVADWGNNMIRKINTTGYVSTLAGSRDASYLDGQGTNARFFYPAGLTMDNLGNIYVSDRQNNIIRVINTTNYVSTLAGSGAPSFENGQGTNAALSWPVGITMNASGSLYVADRGNQRIRMINSTGYVGTLAGSGANAFSDDLGTSAMFELPTGIVSDNLGNIFVADEGGHRIRKINATGYVSTLAGSGSGAFSDGQGQNATFKSPAGLDIDIFGNIYIADSNNHRIRKLNATGYVTTVAGNGNASFVDGPGANAMFYLPRDVTIDSVGNLYVADYYNNCIRKISMNSTISSTSSPTVAISSSIMTILSTVISISTSPATSLTASSIKSSSSISATSSTTSFATTSIKSLSSLISQISPITQLITITGSPNQNQQYSFYYKPEFIYSAFVGFSLVILASIQIATRRAPKVILRRKVIYNPPE